jgi:hypothetical protein
MWVSERRPSESEAGRDLGLVLAIAAPCSSLATTERIPADELTAALAATASRSVPGQLPVAFCLGQHA